jgi:uncharacterized protein (DUF433 family)
MTLETIQKIPLALWKDGSIRVKGTRLLLDFIIGAYKRGETPEDIVDAFPSVAIADVYSIIAYYLTHKSQIEKYLAKREKEAVAIKKQIESMPGYKENREKLRGKFLGTWKEIKT